MKVSYTDDKSSQFETILMYGLAGAGKTPMAASYPNTIIVSTEPGLKSLARLHLPYVTASSDKEAMDVLKWIMTSSEGRKFEHIFFDSISALSENILQAEKKKSNDPRKFSPATTANTMEVVKAYLDVPRFGKHLTMTCKAVEEIIEGLPPTRRVLPFAVVPKLGPILPYHFDNVLYISRQPATPTTQEYAMLTCRQNDFAYMTRNRGDMLALYEPADLNHIIRKLNGAT